MSRFPSILNKIIFGLLMLLLGYSALNELSLPMGNIANLSLIKSTTISPFTSPFQPRVGQVNGKDSIFQLMPNGNIFLHNASGQGLATSLDNELSGSLQFNTDRSDIYWMVRGIIAYQIGQVDNAVNLWSNEPDMSKY